LQQMGQAGDAGRVAKLMRHESIETTMGYYVDWTPTNWRKTYTEPTERQKAPSKCRFKYRWASAAKGIGSRGNRHKSRPGLEFRK